jgi:HK97 gp10 family phage protein
MPITIDGLSELSDMLTRESARTAKRYLLNVTKPAADVVVTAMEATAPVETGRLDAGIDYQSQFTGGGDGTTLTVKIGPARGTFWGMFQEFGTATEPAQHWMQRAWESCQDKCLSVFGTEALARLADMEEKK